MTRLVNRLPDGVRRRLVSPAMWIVIAYFAIGFLLVFGLKLSAKTAREQTTREATSQAAAQSAEARCIGSIPVLVKVNKFFEGEREGWSTLVENSHANLAITAPDDPAYPTRLKNLHRLETAKAKVAAVDKFPIPTEEQCHQLGGTS